MVKMNWIDKVTGSLCIVGAINWGLDAISYNVVDMVLPMMWATYVYYIVGVSGVYFAYRAIQKFK